MTRWTSSPPPRQSGEDNPPWRPGVPRIPGLVFFVFFLTFVTFCKIPKVGFLLVYLGFSLLLEKPLHPPPFGSFFLSFAYTNEHLCLFFFYFLFFLIFLLHSCFSTPVLSSSSYTRALALVSYAPPVLYSSCFYICGRGSDRESLTPKV